MSFDFSDGTLVWALWVKWNKTYWPGMVVPYKEVGLKQTAKNNVLVYWFGDNTVSECSTVNMLPYRENFDAVFKRYNSKSNKDENWMKACYQSLKTYAANCKLDTTDWTKYQYFLWVETNNFKIDNCILNYTAGIPADIQEQLKQIKKQIVKHTEYDDLLNFKMKNLQKSLKQQKINLETLCISCYGSAALHDHPLFQAKLCSNCLENFKQKIYIYGDDKIAYHCSICIRKGDTIVCGKTICGRVYCKKCIEILGSTNAIKKIMQERIWVCFLCKLYNIDVDGFIKCRSDWRLKLSELFNGSRKIKFMEPTGKYNLKVLSFSDGISAGFLALRLLGFKIEKYFAFETDENAIAISNYRFGKSITHINDLVSYNKSEIEKLGPINLILGNLNSEESNIFDIWRVLLILKKQNKNEPLFWIVQHKARMIIELRKTVDRFLKENPMLDNLEQFYWTNIPIYNIRSLKDQTVLSTVNDYLNLNSLCTDNSDGSNVNISKLEMICGFPVGFTNVSGLTVIQRQSLIGTSWYIPSIKCALENLVIYFHKKFP